MSNVLIVAGFRGNNMWRRTAAKLSSLRSVTRPNNHIVTPTLWTAPIVARHYSGGVVYKKLQEFWRGRGPMEPTPGGHMFGMPRVKDDYVDRDFLKAPFGTKESPAVLKSYYDLAVAGCYGPTGAYHYPVDIWLETGKLHVCRKCSQYFKLECVGKGGYPRFSTI